MSPTRGSASSAAAESRLHILLVEDHPLFSSSLCRYLESHRHRVNRATDLRTARFLLEVGEFDLLLTDLLLPDGLCHELLDGSAARLPRFVVTMSGSDVNPPPLNSVGGALRHHLSKPFEAEDLDSILEGLLEELTDGGVGARIDGMVPPLVRTILREAARRHQCGELSDGQLAEKLSRLTREELDHRGLELIVRPLEWGTRFLIKQTGKGKFCDMIDCHCATEEDVA